MVHVWIAPHVCGPFAALEGHGAGQASVSDGARMDLCDHDHGDGAHPHDHGAGCHSIGSIPVGALLAAAVGLGRVIPR